MVHGLKLKKPLFYPVVLLLALVVALPGYAADAVSAEQAAKVYSDNCAVCHGDKGDGQSRARFGLNPPPRDFTSADAAKTLSRELMIDRVTHGKPATAMVAWQSRLSSAEIAGVVDYIRSSFMAPATPVKVTSVTAAAVPTTPMALGKKIFEDNCRVCHGDRGNGATWTNTVLDPPPRNFTSPQSRRILTRTRMLASVTHGRPGTAMMSFSSRLSAAEIAAVVDYIGSTFMKGPVIADADMSNMAAASDSGHGQAMTGMAGAAMAPRNHQTPAAVDMKAGFPGDFKGDFDKGRLFYMDNCSTCHGVRGDGMGPRSHFIEPKPRNFLNPESRQQLNRPALFRAIFLGKPGTVMPAWGKVLTPQQLADVAEFVFQDFIHPNPDAIKAQAEVGELGKKKAH